MHASGALGTCTCERMHRATGRPANMFFGSAMRSSSDRPTVAAGLRSSGGYGHDCAVARSGRSGMLGPQLRRPARQQHSDGFDKGRRRCSRRWVWPRTIPLTGDRVSRRRRRHDVIGHDDHRHRSWCWGYNGSGQLGDGTTTKRQIAAPVMAGSASLRLFAKHRQRRQLHLHQEGRGLLVLGQRRQRPRLARLERRLSPPVQRYERRRNRARNTTRAG